MANIPRVEITDLALKVLKTEAANSGLGQKETLEALVVRGASAQTIRAVDTGNRTAMLNEVYMMVACSLVRGKKTVSFEETHAAVVNRSIVSESGAVNWPLVENLGYTQVKGINAADADCDEEASCSLYSSGRCPGINSCDKEREEEEEENTSIPVVEVKPLMEAEERKEALPKVELLPLMHIATEKPMIPQLAEGAAIDSTGPDVSQKRKKLAENQTALTKIKDMWKAGEHNQAEIARVIGYHRATVNDNIKRMRENGELVD